MAEKKDAQLSMQKKLDLLALEVGRLQQTELYHRKVAEELRRFNELLIGMWNELHIEDSRKVRAMNQLLAQNKTLRFHGFMDKYEPDEGDAYEDDNEGDDEGDEADEKDSQDDSASKSESGEYDTNAVAKQYKKGDITILVQYSDLHDEKISIAYSDPEGTYRCEWTSVTSTDHVDWRALCENVRPNVAVYEESHWLVGWVEGVFPCKPIHKWAT